MNTLLMRRDRNSEMKTRGQANSAKRKVSYKFQYSSAITHSMRVWGSTHFAADGKIFIKTIAI